MEFPGVAKKAVVFVLRPDSSAALVKKYTSLSVQIKVVLKPASRAFSSQTEAAEEFIY